jgi:hypothetical protein
VACNDARPPSRTGGDGGGNELPRFRPHQLQPGAPPARLVQELNDIQQEIARDLGLLGRRVPVSAIQLGDYASKYREVVRLSPPAAGARLILPEPVRAQADARVVAIVEGDTGPLSVEVVNGTINGQQVLEFGSGFGFVEFVCDGTSGWWTFSPELTGSAPSDAEFVVAVADPSLPSARVATDSTEIDADVTSPGVISWALNVASVAFSKLANLTGLSVLGRAASTTGVMAAITASGGRQVLRTNDAGTGVVWGQPVNIRDGGVNQGDCQILDFVDGTNTTALATVSGQIGTIRIDSVDTTYTAGDGIDLTGTVFSADVSDFAGAGLEDDGSNNLRIAAAAAGAGLTGGAGSALAVGAGTHITVNANDVAVDTTSLLAGIDSTSIVVSSGTLQRAAVSGDITIAQNSNTAAITAGVIVDADVNASAAIAQTKTGALTGDVTKASGSAVTVIAAGAVTNAMRADMAAGTVSGRQIDAGTGAPVDLTGAEQGENIRRSSGVTDAISATSDATYAVASTTTMIRFSSGTGTRTIHGLTATSDTFGKTLTIEVEQGVSGVVEIPNESGSAGAAGERVRTPDGTTISLTANQRLVMTYYDNRWRVESYSKDTTYSAGDSTITLTGTAFTRPAITGDVGIPAGSNVSAIGAGVIVDADVNASAAIDPAKLGALTGEVTKASGSAATAIVRSTNFAWTGNHTFSQSANWTVAASGVGADILMTAASGINLAAGAHTASAADPNDIVLNASGGIRVSASATASTGEGTGVVGIVADDNIKLTTNGVERLEIESDGAWQLAGDTGDDDEVFTSRGGSAPPVWASKSWVNSTKVHLRDDFTGGHQGFDQGHYGETGWLRLRTGDSGGELVGIPGVSNHPGIVQLSTSTTQQIAAMVRGINWTNSSDADDWFVVQPNQVDRFEWVVRTGATITSSEALVGLMQNATAASGGTAGVYFRYNSTTQAWQGRCRNASTTSTTSGSSGTVGPNTWSKLLAVRSGGTWEFFCDSASFGTLSTNVPTATGCQICARIENTTSANRTLDVDLFQLEGTVTR